MARRSWREQLAPIAVLMVLVCLTGAVSTRVSHRRAGRGSVSGNTTGEPEGTPQYVVDTGTEFVWQQPREVKGIIFLAHGCSHAATDWFDKSAACPLCIGLPEERRIVRAALAAGYVALAVSSQDRAFSRCWSEDDVEPVVRILAHIRHQLGLGSLPVVALGASSGGGFLPILAQRVRLAAMAVQIAAAHPSLLSKTFPPTAFIHMPRDSRTAARVAGNVRDLKAFGVPAHDWPQPPLPLTPLFFSDRIEGITPQLSQRMFTALKTAGYLDDKGLLSHDPRESSWRQVLIDKVPDIKNLNLAADQSGISEVLNVAWSEHEMTSEAMPQTIAFFDAMLKRRIGRQ